MWKSAMRVHPLLFVMTFISLHSIWCFHLFITNLQFWTMKFWSQKKICIIPNTVMSKCSISRCPDLQSVHEFDMRSTSLINHYVKPLQILFLCGQSTLGRNTMKSMHSIHWQKTFPWAPEWVSERASEQMRTAERASKASGAKRAARSKWMSERESRGAHGPVL